MDTLFWIVVTLVIAMVTFQILSRSSSHTHTPPR